MPTAAGMEYFRERPIDDCKGCGERLLAIALNCAALYGLAIRSFLSADRGEGRRKVRRFWITARRIAAACAERSECVGGDMEGVSECA